MIITSKKCIGFVILGFELLTPVVWGQQPVSDAQNKLLAKRAAEADALRKLAETINGVQVNSETFVRDFVAESDQIQTAVDTLVKGARFGQPVYYDDGVCEVTAEVTVQKVITDLKEIHTRHYHGDRVKGTDFENIRQYIQKDIIQVVGMGAPRAELPPGLPQGYEEVITQVQVAPLPVAPVPGIWKTIPPQARLMAKRAAEVDAQRRLLERIKGLRLTSDTLVKDFVAQYDEIRTSASDVVVGARETGVYYHDDELIVEVTMEVPVESVISHLQELHTRHYRGDSVKGTDISNLKQFVNAQVFESTGCGVPSAQYLQQVISTPPPVISTPSEPAAPPPPSLPPWATDRISATGQGPDPEGGTPQGKMKAIRTAALDAKRKLIEMVQGLKIDSATSVKDFVAQFDEVNAQLQGLLVGATEEKTEFNSGEGIATVVVSVPGMQVWAVIHGQMEVVERRN